MRTALEKRTEAQKQKYRETDARNRLRRRQQVAKFQVGDKLYRFSKKCDICKKQFYANVPSALRCGSKCKTAANRKRANEAYKKEAKTRAGRARHSQLVSEWYYKKKARQQQQAATTEQ